MTCRLLRPHWLVCFLPAAVVSPLAAQVDVRAELGSGYRYAWRGITRTTGWVLHVHAGASAEVGPGAVGAGVIEVREVFAAGATDLTLVGRGRHGLGERNWWAEYHVPVGLLDLGGGVVRFTYHGDARLGGRPPAENTTEIYVRAEGKGTYVLPALAAYWDVDHVRGVYLEASGTLPILGWPWPPEVFVYLDAVLGLSVGEARPASGTGGYYAGDGFTHAELGASVDLTQFRRVVFWTSGRFHFGFDDRTRLGEGDSVQRVYGTFRLGATIGLGLPSR